MSSSRTGLISSPAGRGWSGRSSTDGLTISGTVNGTGGVQVTGSTNTTIINISNSPTGGVLNFNPATMAKFVTFSGVEFGDFIRTLEDVQIGRENRDRGFGGGRDLTQGAQAAEAIHVAEVIVEQNRARRQTSHLAQRVMAAAGLGAVQCAEAHQLGQFEVVDDAVGLLQRLVELLAGAGDLDAPPELLADLRDALQRLAQSAVGAGHAAELPHEFADFAVEGVGGDG